MVGHGGCPPLGLPECASRTPVGSVACRDDGAGQWTWERCTRQSADLAARTTRRCPPAASNVRTRRWTGASASQRRRRARSARCSRAEVRRRERSVRRGCACHALRVTLAGDARIRHVDRRGGQSNAWATSAGRLSSPGQPSYPGLSRQADPTGIMEDRAGRTSATSRSPRRRRGDDRPAIGHCGHRAEGQPRPEKAEKGQQPEAAHRRRRHLPAPGRKGPCSRPPAATSCAGE